MTMVFHLAQNGTVNAVDVFDEGVVTRWLGGELRGLSQHFRRTESKIAFLRDFLWPNLGAVMYNDFSWAIRYRLQCGGWILSFAYGSTRNNNRMSPPWTRYRNDY